MLLGRDTEKARVATLIDAARAGRSDVLVIRGEAGIGKSALLNYARIRFADALVLSTRATDFESEIPYVHLADLIRPVAAALDDLAPRQSKALAGVLALGPAVAGDRYAVAAATLSLFGTLAQRQPLLILIDDVQWVDQFSAEVLTFVGNRFRAEGALVLITLRTSETAPDGLIRFAQLTLRGLDDAAAQQLVESAGRRLSRTAMTRLMAEAAGNPLALLELSAHLEQARSAAVPDDREPLPVGERVERAFRRSLDRLPAECRDALLVLATLGSATTDLVRSAMAAAELTPDSLAAAEDAELLIDQDGRLGFRHPLIRAVVHQTAAPSQRRQAHLHVAEALTGSSAPHALERRAWHLVASGGAPDEGIAAALEASANEEYNRANFAVAANVFERSSEIGRPGPALAGRLLRAADAYRVAGAIEMARQILVRAQAAAEDEPLSLIIRYYAARIDLWRGAPALRTNDLVVLARQVESFDSMLAARFLGDAALACADGGQLRTAAELCGRAKQLIGADPAPLDVDIVTALGHGLRGEDSEAREILTARADEVDAIDPIATGHVDQLGLVAALGHLAIEEVERADLVLVTAISGARDASAVGVLPFRLGRLAWARYWQGRWTSAVALATEALQLAEATGWTREIPNSLGVLARIAAASGNADECASYADRAMSYSQTHGIEVAAGYAHCALGLLALGAGDNDAAVRELEQVAAFAEPNGLVDTPMLWWSSDLIQALVGIGRVDEARSRLRALDRTLENHRMPTLAAVAARCHALVDHNSGDEHLLAALHHHDEAAMPFERARSELALGTTLRRAGRSADAARHLDAARDAFVRLGAHPWVEPARTEPHRAQPPEDGTPPLFARLTPQELQVAVQVARGLSNREVAARLFLSVKTVEFHLSNVFHKLGVKRRAQLAMIVARQEGMLAGAL